MIKYIYYTSLVVGIIAIALYASKSDAETTTIQSGLEQITNLQERDRLYVELAALKKKQEIEEDKVWINRLINFLRRQK